MRIKITQKEKVLNVLGLIIGVILSQCLILRREGTIQISIAIAMIIGFSAPLIISCLYSLQVKRKKALQEDATKRK